jgi:hypothetical protein
MHKLAGGILAVGGAIAGAGCTSLLGDFSPGGGASTDGSAPDAPDAEDSATGPDVQSDATSDRGTGPEGSPCGAAACDAGPTSCMSGYTLCTSGGTRSCVDESNDPNNCGGCGQQCPTGAQCSGKLCTPTTVLSGAPLVTAISLACDTTNVYWVNAPNALVYQVPIAGGSAIVLSNSNPTGPAVNVGITGTTVAYTLNWGGEQVQLYTATVGAANSATELLVLCTASTPSALANAGSTFYAACPINNPPGYTVAKAALTDTSATTLYSASTGTPGKTMAAASNAVFWTDTGAGVVDYYSSAVSGMTGTVAYGETSPQNLATDGSNLYWVSGSASSAQLRKAPAHPAPQTPSTVAMVSGNTWSGQQTVASNGTNFYWGDTSGGKPGIYMAPVAGGTPTLRAASLGAVPATLAVCGSKLVWFEGNPTGVIRAVQLP